MTPSITRLGAAAFTTLAVAVTAPMALAAQNDDPAEAKAVLASGMTLAEAIAAAQTHSGGTAMSAAWESQSSGAMAFEVELAKPDGTVTTVAVDPASGNITRVAEHETDDDGLKGDDNDSCEQDD